jgi:integrase
LVEVDQDISRRSSRGRGTIRKHGAGYQVRVSAGTDPVTGERLRLQGTARTSKEADKLLTKLLRQADAFRSARTSATLGYLLDRWLPQHDVDEQTIACYDSLIRNHIRPALGDVRLTTLVRKATEVVEMFFADLRRCRARCDRRWLIDHQVVGLHDCVQAGCQPHVCRPLSAATVCRIHAVLSGACTAAVRWGWIPFNPMEAVRKPRQPRPNPQPPTPAEAARFVEEATRQDPEWGLYLWLALITGARRGELCALRWTHIDLDTGVVTIRRNYVAGREKDPKTHQIRRLSIDAATVELIRQHQTNCEKALAPVGVALDPLALSSPRHRTDRGRAARAHSRTASRDWPIVWASTRTCTRCVTTPQPNCWQQAWISARSRDASATAMARQRFGTTQPGSAEPTSRRQASSAPVCCDEWNASAR